MIAPASKNTLSFEFVWNEIRRERVTRPAALRVASADRTDFQLIQTRGVKARSVSRLKNNCRIDACPSISQS